MVERVSHEFAPNGVNDVDPRRRRHCASGIILVEFVYRGGLLEGAGLRLRAVCGRAGVTLRKQEGDGATPVGVLPLLRVLYRADRVKTPKCGVPVEPISRADGWCDDVDDVAYNKPVRLPYAGRHEALWRDDGVYDVIGVLGWKSLLPLCRGGGRRFFCTWQRRILRRQLAAWRLNCAMCWPAWKRD